MLHAPTSENKQRTDAKPSQLTPKRERKLHPHHGSALGLAWLGAAPSRLPPTSPVIERFASMQSVYGNQAVLRMLDRSRSTIQTKLMVNQPGDRYEQEANRMADQVMRMPEIRSRKD